MVKDIEKLRESIYTSNQLEHLLKEGIDRAIEEDWETIDNTLIPRIIQEYKLVEEQEIKKQPYAYGMLYALLHLFETGRHEKCHRCMGEEYTEYTCDNLRDYAASVCQELIRNNLTRPFQIRTLPSCRAVFRPTPLLIEGLERLLSDPAKYVRFRAACALTEAYDKGLLEKDSSLKKL